MSIESEANHTMNYLCSAPIGSGTTVETKVLKYINLNFDACILVRGHLYSIKRENMGAGCYKLWLKLAPLKY